MKELIEKATETFRIELNEMFKEKLKQRVNDYIQGTLDCKLGIYDKWYRYNRQNDGRDYDKGWTEANEIIQNETVKFIYK